MQTYIEYHPSVRYGEYVIYRRRDKRFEYEDAKDNVITIAMIKNAIKHLKQLFPITDITVMVEGYFVNQKTEECYQTHDFTAIEIVGGNKIRLRDVDYKVNIIEDFEAIPDYNIEARTYYSNMINSIKIKFETEKK